MSKLLEILMDPRNQATIKKRLNNRLPGLLSPEQDVDTSSVEGSGRVAEDSTIDTTRSRLANDLIAHLAGSEEGLSAPPEVLTALIRLLRDQGSDNRQAAAGALGALGAAAATPEVIAELVGVLATDHEEIAVRRAVGEALGHLGDRAATSEVIAELASILATDDNDIWDTVVDILAMFDPEKVGPCVNDKIVELLRRDDGCSWMPAFSLLRNLGPTALTSDVLTELAANLVLGRGRVNRVAAAECIADIAATSPEINIQLRIMLSDRNAEVKISAIQALAGDPNVIAPETVHDLGRLLRDGNPAVRSTAHALISRMPNTLQTHVVSLVHWVSQDNFPLRAISKQVAGPTVQVHEATDGRLSITQRYGDAGGLEVQVLSREFSEGTIVLVQLVSEETVFLSRTVELRPAGVGEVLGWMRFTEEELTDLPKNTSLSVRRMD